MLTEAHCKNATCPPEKARARLADSGGCTWKSPAPTIQRKPVKVIHLTGFLIAA
jgi:hypothetical protein